jgi:hypothetical protein
MSRPIALCIDDDLDNVGADTSARAERTAIDRVEPRITARKSAVEQGR